jgi:hypothetical protein
MKTAVEAGMVWVVVSMRRDWGGLGDIPGDAVRGDVEAEGFVLVGSLVVTRRYLVQSLP